VTGNIVVGVSAGIGAAVVQTAVLKLRNQKIEMMQWASLALVLVLGTATLVTRNPHFMVVKPTIAAFAIACVMLRPGWMARYLPSIVTEKRVAVSAACMGLYLVCRDLRARRCQSHCCLRLRAQDLGLVHGLRSDRSAVVIISIAVFDYSPRCDFHDSHPRRRRVKVAQVSSPHRFARPHSPARSYE
jgi:hypothetical protein